MLTFVTSFSPAGWNRYARGLVDSFYDLADPHITLLSYWEGPRPAYGGLLPGYDLFELEPCKSFLTRHRGNLETMGRKQAPGMIWGRKARKEKYSFRHDAYKFARKVFAVADAARRQGRGRLFWIDADVVIKRKLERDLLCKLLPQDKALCYLARPIMHSETGFVGYNLDLVETHAFLTAFEAEYSEDCFLRRSFWDDCHVFDALVHELKPPVAKIQNTSNSQPFDNSELGLYMTHLKGRRKLEENA